MKYGKIGERYIPGNENVSYRELISVVRKITEKKFLRFPLSIKLLKTLGSIEKTRSNWTKKQPLILPEFSRKLLFDWKVESSKAMKELNYRPISFFEGIEKMIDRLNQQNGIFDIYSTSQSLDRMCACHEW